jgi:hypothetical protein
VIFEAASQQELFSARQVFQVVHNEVMHLSHATMSIKKAAMVSWRLFYFSNARKSFLESFTPYAPASSPDQTCCPA